MTVRTVKLRNTWDASGTRHLAASIKDDGRVVISGQDLGRGVEEFFGSGNTEYEWEWTIEPGDVLKMAKELGSTDDVLGALARSFSGDNAANLQTFLDDAGIPYSTWSRVGD